MSTRTQSTVVAVFSNEADARAAADDLRTSGFKSDEIFVSSDANANYGDESRTVRSDPNPHHEGGIKGWFKSVFGQDDENERPYYENAVQGGSALVSVNVTAENIDRAADVLNRHSPADVHRETDEPRARSAAASSSATAAPAGVTRGRTDIDAEKSRSIPVVEEELRIGKRSILRGGVRVYSRVVEEPVQESIRLREEHVRVERTPVNRPTTEADLRAGQQEVVEVKEYAEEPVVSKQSRVVEEVRVGKEATERTETVRDNVRRTEVNVENLNESDVQGRASRRQSGTSTGAAAQTATTGVNDEDFRRHFRDTYGTTGERYETYGPAYEYGYTMAGDPRYQGRNFDEVESDLRTDYGRRYPNSTWEKMKDSIRYGWNKLTRKV